MRAPKMRAVFDAGSRGAAVTSGCARTPAEAAAARVSQRRRCASIILDRSQRASELRPELHAVGARIVDEAGQVVEVDRTDGDDLVRDVAAERGDFVLAVGPDVADAQAAGQQRLAGELGRF